jgi:glyoxylase-like metal-dependent hydrolase (beta-lactamase superfamily II)
MAHRTRVGDVEIISLVDSNFRMPPERVYFEAGDRINAYRHYLLGDGAVYMDCNAFLLRTAGTTVLVDTGQGPEAEGRLLSEMDDAGVLPVEVDVVVFTHLHGDHTGWNIDRESGEPTFKRARYLVPRGDFEHYKGGNSRSFERDIAPLQKLGSLELIEGEHPVAPSMVTVATPGHTPGHTSIAIDSGGERAFILGDVVLTQVDAEEPEWPNTFDSDHEVARRTRLAMLDRLEASRELVGAAHLPAPGFGRFVRVEGRRSWLAGAP